MFGSEEQAAYDDERAAELQPQALPRYPGERCGDCGRGLTWLEIAFGRVFDPVCGRCLMAREGKTNG